MTMTRRNPKSHNNNFYIGIDNDVTYFDGAVVYDDDNNDRYAAAGASPGDINKNGAILKEILDGYELSYQSYPILTADIKLDKDKNVYVIARKTNYTDRYKDNSILKWSHSTDTWTIIADIDVEKYYASLGIDEFGRVYVIGRGSPREGKIYRYNDVFETWDEMPIPSGNWNSMFIDNQVGRTMRLANAVRTSSFNIAEVTEIHEYTFREWYSFSSDGNRTLLEKGRIEQIPRTFKSWSARITGPFPDSSLATQRMRAMAIHPITNNIWAGTYSGIYEFDGTAWNKKFDPFQITRFNVSNTAYPISMAFNSSGDFYLYAERGSDYELRYKSYDSGNYSGSWQWPGNLLGGNSWELGETPINDSEHGQRQHPYPEQFSYTIV